MSPLSTEARCALSHGLGPIHSKLPFLLCSIVWCRKGERWEELAKITQGRAQHATRGEVENFVVIRESLTVDDPLKKCTHHRTQRL